MPRLPDATSLGGLPSADSGRPIASFDTTAIGRGMQSLGGSLDKVAANIDTAVTANSELEYMRAKADFYPKHIELQNSFNEDKDYNTYEKRYQDGAVKARDEAAAGISNAKFRQRFITETADDLARGHVSIRGFAKKKEADYGVADTFRQLDTLKDTIFKAPDEEGKTRLIDSAGGLIDAAVTKGWVTELKGAELKKSWTENYARDWLKTMPAEERATLLRGPVSGSGAVVDRILGVESGGDPNARSRTSSATGLGQFVEGTWLDTVSKHRPDIVAGKSREQILALRTDPALSREMTGRLVEDNSAALTGAGVPTTSGNVYLAHFLGVGDAAKVLKADPSTPVASLVDRKSIAANKSVLEGKTAGDVAAWANRKMGGSGGNSPLQFIPEQERAILLQQADQESTQNFIKSSALRSEGWERKLIDSSAGKAPLPAREEIETDPSIDEPRRNTLLRQYDSAAGDVAAFQRILTKFKDPTGGAFNPYDTDERKGVDTLYKSMGGGTEALQGIVDRTGIVPQSAAVALRGDIVSGDTARVAKAMTLSANMLNKNPNVFTGVQGQKDFEDNAVSFRHYVDDLGMTAEDAAKRIIRDQSPEYQASVKARLKTEDIDAKIKKELSISDLSGAFDDSWIPFNDPSIGFEPASRQAMYSQYAEQVRERYMETGDWSLAKKHAADTMKKTWGVSLVNGSKSVMQYPPERAPAYAGISDAPAMIAQQAIDAVKDTTGEVVEAKGLRLMPVPGMTAQAFKAGKPVPYMLMWQDKNGAVQTLNPGKAFVADPAAMRARVTDDRKAKFDAARSFKAPEDPFSAGAL